MTNPGSTDSREGPGTAGPEAPAPTPGPWKIVPNFGGSRYPSIVNPAGDAELGDWMVAEQVRWAADAALIQAAPELLAALDEADSALEAAATMLAPTHPKTAANFGRICARARAAIALAEGR